MIRSLRCAVFMSIALLWLIGCQQKPQPLGRTIEPGAPDEGAVGFDITPLNANADARNWLATYTAEGKTAKFQIEFGATKLSSGVTFGDGKLIAEPGSDASTLLRSLKKALEAKSLPTHVKRVSELSFKYAIIGDRLSHASGGGFNAEPVGNWIATKIFLANGEAEVFLNTNPTVGKPEFSIKDPDYGDQVLAELAKVL